MGSCIQGAECGVNWLPAAVRPVVAYGPQLIGVNSQESCWSIRCTAFYAQKTEDGAEGSMGTITTLKPAFSQSTRLLCDIVYLNFDHFG